MSRCKPPKAVSFPTLTRYEWSKAYLAKPKDNLIAHPDSLIKHTFRPSFEKDGDPTIDCLLDWSYARIWHSEAQEFRLNRTPVAKPAKKKFPVYANRKATPVEVSRERFTLKRFQNVPAKVDTRLSVICFRMAKLRSIFKKHLIPNLERKCRLCLSDKEIVQSIFQSENSKETTDTLVEKIFECTAIMLSKDYDFPSPICEDCALKLDEFLLFRTKCLRSNEIYRFNRLHKQRLLFTRKPIVEDSGVITGGRQDSESTASTDEPDGGAGGDVCNTEDIVIPIPYTVPSVVIAEASGSSSSDSRTVIEQQLEVAENVLAEAERESVEESTQQNGTEEADESSSVQQEHPHEKQTMECNGNHRGSSSGLEEPDDEQIPRWKPPPDPDDSESTGKLSPAPVVLIVDETDTTVSETDDGEEVILLSAELLDPSAKGDEELDGIGDVKFPIETIEQLEHLERLVRTCEMARERYINILRRLKTHDTSLSNTYQRLFADRLLIHYNYDGISPKYNKRPLKTLLLFTECMAVAWEDHMDVVRLRMVIAEDTPLTIGFNK
uniref:ZAD domain-containing protein n=1 Tax=Anopheles epiroticus TaxID=199890 RepID=A0A182PNH7_9DIPT